MTPLELQMKCQVQTHIWIEPPVITTLNNYCEVLSKKGLKTISIVFFAHLSVQICKKVKVTRYLQILVILLRQKCTFKILF